MVYNKAVEYVNSFIDFEKIPKYSYASSFKLERMLAFLEGLGNPHQGLNFIHIAGSKGKGSTSAIAAYILKECGYAAGLYTSPHLLDMRERIRVLTRCSSFVVRDPKEFKGSIGKREFAGLIEKIKPVSEKFREHEKFGQLSFFEILTAAAFLYFKMKKVDISVLETGLGGRLDATNVVTPIASGMTNISLEHADKLGDTLDSIAGEKAGIIKGPRTSHFVPVRGRQGVVVSARQEDIVRDVIRQKCHKENVALLEVGRDIKYSIVDSGETRQIFNMTGPGYSYEGLKLNLLGSHQVENACVAVAMLKAIGNGIKIHEKALRDGLQKACWPGRLQVLRKNPYLVLDGAQNVASFMALLSSIKAIFSYSRLISVFGISRDKDIEGVCRQLEKASDVIILTRSSSPRAEDPLLLRERFSYKDIRITDNVTRALETALEISGSKDLILVTGSLYVVGEAIGLYGTCGIG